jgi:hypothetical protein
LESALTAPATVPVVAGATEVGAAGVGAGVVTGATEVGAAGAGAAAGAGVGAGAAAVEVCAVLVVPGLGYINTKHIGKF